MLKKYKTVASPWIFGVLFFVFFIVLSYGFIVLLNTKSFSGSLKQAKVTSSIIKKKYFFDDYKNKENKEILQSYFLKKISKRPYVDKINLIINEKGNRPYTVFPDSDISLDDIFAEKINSTLVFYDINSFYYTLVYPVDIGSERSVYLLFQGNISSFLKFSHMTEFYIGMSLVCFLIIGWSFYHQYLKLKITIAGELETEKILAEKSRNDEITARFARSVLLSGSLNETAVFAREAASQLIGGEYAFAGYMDGSQSYLNICLSSSKYEEILGETNTVRKICRFYGIWKRAMDLKKSLYTNEATDDDRKLPGRNSDYKASSVLAVPAVIKDQVVGIIVVANRKIPFTQSDMKALERIASIYAVSIQKESVFAKLKESENQFRVAFKTNPEAVLITTFPEGIIVDYNQGFLSFLGYEANEIVKNKMSGTFLWQNKVDRENIISKIESHGKITNYEAKFVCKEGAVTGLISAAKVFLNGRPHMLSIIRNIEKLKSVEDELRKERAFLSMVVETSPAGIVAVDGKTGHILYANQRTSDILEVSIDGLKKKNITDEDWDIRDFNLNKIDPKDHIFNILQDSRQAQYDIKHTFLSGQGKRVYLSMNATPIIDDNCEVDVFVASVDDISHKVLTQKFLDEAEERLNSVIGTLPVILWSVDENGIISLCRGMGLKSLNLLPDSIVGESVYERYKDHEDILEFIKEGLNGKSFSRVLKFNGRYYQVTGSGMTDHNGKIVGISGLAADISQKIKMEDEQAILSAAIEQAAESIVITDNRGEIIYVNPAFENISGYSKLEAVGKKPSIIKSDYHDKFFYDDMWKSLKRGQIWNGYLRNRSKDGKFFEEEASISPVFDRYDKIQNFVAVKRDVTQERQMEKQLRKAQKMEAIGTLAGGIAHDFNNILFPIIGFTELLQAKTSDKSEDRRYLDNILSAAYRAKELVHQILTFSRQNEEEKRPVKLHVIVKEVLKLLRASIPSIIEIRYDIEETQFPVMADPIKIHQLVMNLGTNAYQAMEQTGGTLNITLQTIDLINEDIKALGFDSPQGKYVKLSITDTGTGIPKDVIDRIYEPYFTTKPQGKGTGLGLSTVHGIVISCGGLIRVESFEGQGSCFDVFLPAVNESHLPVNVVQEEEAEKGTESILIVDDEELIVEVIKDMLEDLGYSATIRTSSIDALEAFKAHPQKYDLVVTDHTMPNMTGIDLSREIRHLRPDIPIIVCSGFSDVITKQKAENLGISAFIMKPILKTDLSKAIRKCLDEKK